MIYKYSNNLIPGCIIAELHLQSDIIHEHNYTGGCHQLRVPPSLLHITTFSILAF